MATIPVILSITDDIQATDIPVRFIQINYERYCEVVSFGFTGKIPTAKVKSPWNSSEEIPVFWNSEELIWQCSRRPRWTN